jgi:WD40 repeat protein
MTDFTKSALLVTFPFEGAWPMAVAFAGIDRVVSGNRKGEVFVWDLPKEPVAKDSPPHFPVFQLKGHTNAISGVAATSDGKTIITSSLDRTVRKWSLAEASTEKAEVILDITARQAEAKKKRNDEALKRPGVQVGVYSNSQTINTHKDWAMSLSISPDESHIISGDGTAQVRVNAVDSGKQVAEWTGHAWNWVVSSALSPDNKTALVSEYRSPRGDFDRPTAALKLWDVATGKEKLDLLKIMFPKLRPDDSSYGSSRIWRKFVGRGLLGASFSPDGKLVAVGKGGETDTGKVSLFSTETGKLEKTISGHRYGLTDIKFSQDGEHVVSVGRDTMVRVCRIKDGKEIATFNKSRGGQFKDWLAGVAISPDEKHLAAADIAGKIHVWQLSGDSK